MAYIPVYTDSPRLDDVFPSRNPFQKNDGRPKLLQFLLKSLECASERQLSTAHSGLTEELFDGQKIPVNSMIAFHKADVPEVERLLSLNREIRPICPAIDVEARKINLPRQKYVKCES